MLHLGDSRRRKSCISCTMTRPFNAAVTTICSDVPHENGRHLPAAREAMVALMQLVGPKDVPIGKVANLAIPSPNGDIPARSYTPVAAGGEPLPALIFFHGGGFVIGSVETHDGLCRMLANLSA